MLLVSDRLTVDEQPVILALGVERTGGKFHCEVVYVSPTPGTREDHAPIGESVIGMRYYASAEAEPESVRVKWPGLTTSQAAGRRVHNDIILSITREETSEQESSS